MNRYLGGRLACGRQSSSPQEENAGCFGSLLVRFSHGRTQVPV